MFTEEVIIPQVLEYNSIGFTKKEFLYIDNLGNFTYSNYGSNIWKDKTAIAKALTQNGFDVTFEYLCDFWDNSNIRTFLIVDWSKILSNKENIEYKELAEKIKIQHNSFNTYRYSLIEKFVNEEILKVIQLKNEENIVLMDYKGNDRLNDVFDKLIAIQILKEHGIYAKLNDDFYKLTIKWEKPLDWYYKDDCVYNAKYCQDICDKLLSKEYFVDKTPDFYVEIYRKLSNSEEEKYRHRLTVYKDVELNNIVKPNNIIKLNNIESKNGDLSSQNTISDSEYLAQQYEIYNRSFAMSVFCVILSTISVIFIIAIMYNIVIL